MRKQKLFDYLVAQEKQKPGFRFDRGSDQGLIISYSGYKHMDLFEIRETLQKIYKLKFDFDKGYEKFDRICGRTFCYFKNVYSKES